MEQAPHGVRCYGVCPHPVNTAWTYKETSSLDAKMKKHRFRLYLKPVRVLRKKQQMYIALISDKASYLTGTLYTVDGGITIAKGPVENEVINDMAEPYRGELYLYHTLERHM